MTDLADLHTSVADFEVRDGCLCIGGRKITDIVGEHGSPIYLYDRSLIEKRVQALKAITPDRVKLHYAIKANPMPEIVELLSTLVDGLDIASGGELEVALRTRCPPVDMSFAGPGKSITELEAAIGAGVTINVESPTELGRIAEIAARRGQRPSIAVRVNPDFELKSSGMKMSGGPKQFGIDAEAVPDILARIADAPVRLVGFHVFTGSQNLRPNAICEAHTNALRLALELADSATGPLRFINIGGGLGIPYFPGDTPLELREIARNLRQLASELPDHDPQCALVLELGRYLVGEAGVYVCTITDRKISRGQIFLVTDGGLHHHLAASGNFGQVIRKNYPVAIANRIGSTESENVSIVGPLCTPLDILADRMDLARADVGDLVAVFQSGAYGFSASPHGFLSHPPPRQLLI